MRRLLSRKMKSARGGYYIDRWSTCSRGGQCIYLKKIKAPVGTRHADGLLRTVDQLTSDQETRWTAAVNKAGSGATNGEKHEVRSEKILKAMEPVLRERGGERPADGD